MIPASDDKNFFGTLTALSTFTVVLSTIYSRQLALGVASKQDDLRPKRFAHLPKISMPRLQSGHIVRLAGVNEGNGFSGLRMLSPRNQRTF